MSGLFSNLFGSKGSGGGGGSNPDPAAPESATSVVPAEPEVRLVTNMTKVSGDFGDRDHFYVHASVACGGDATPRIPCNVVLVIDVSGSMGDSVTTASNESTGLNILHIVKHAVNTIKEVCNDNDRLGIVKFNDQAQVVMNMQNMTTAGKEVVDQTLARLSPGGSTNIYGAMEKAFETLRNDPSANVRNSFVLLLTDGVPNVDPPNGLTHTQALEDYRQRHGGNLPGTLSTFGFGYNLESILLRDLSNAAGGMYSFIPDAGMVGTAFINAISNVMCSAIRDVTVTFETGADVVIVPEEELNEVGHAVSARGCSIKRSSVQAGQSYDLVKRISVPKEKSMEEPIIRAVHVDYKFIGQTSSSDSKTSSSNPLTKANISVGDDKYDLEACRWRLRTVSLLKETHATLIRFNQGGMRSVPNPAMEKINKLSTDLQDYIDGNRGMPDHIRDRLRDLCEDVDGQVKEACGRNDYWTKWGRHYLPSLTRAHDLQQSNNFKDPGIQHYGGVLFKAVQEIADDCFSRLPPPQGNPARPNASYSRSSAPAAAPAPVNMAAFNNRDAGCVHGDSVVRLVNGDVKKAHSLIRGDVLSNGCLVEGVLKTICYENEASLCQINDLYVTPYHPVMHKGTWMFPINLAKPVMVPCNALYSFLLKKPDGKYAQSLLCSDIECITLGHGIVNDKVASHPFFGTESVVNCMKSSQAWFRSDGVVTLSQSNVLGALLRDPKTNLICGIVPFEEPVN